MRPFLMVSLDVSGHCISKKEKNLCICVNFMFLHMRDFYNKIDIFVSNCVENFFVKELRAYMDVFKPE